MIAVLQIPNSSRVEETLHSKALCYIVIISVACEPTSLHTNASVIPHSLPYYTLSYVTALLVGFIDGKGLEIWLCLKYIATEITWVLYFLSFYIKYIISYPSFGFKLNHVI